MSCRVAVSCPSDEPLPVLLDLARDGDEATFRELAQCLGMEASRVDELWARTVTRVAASGRRSAAR